MKAITLQIILCLLAFSFAAETTAQVRVRHWKDPERRKSKKNRLIKVEEEREVISPENVDARISAVSTSEVKKELDTRFYVQWGRDEGLRFDDFNYNRNLYNKFLPARDTDLTALIYPDYRDFYKKLAERMTTEGGVNNELRQQKIDQLLLQKIDSVNSGYNPVDVIDTEAIFTITIDSPAASSITISPAIYAVSETSFYFNITALFNKNESWMIVKSRDILEHEQIHFDIFELYARKMRKHLVETLKKSYASGTLADFTNELSPVFETLFEQLDGLQLEFDKQTMLQTSVNASIAQTNSSWKSQLKIQLDSYIEYEMPEGIIVLK